MESLGFDKGNREVEYLLSELKEVDMDFPEFVAMLTAQASEGSEEDLRKVFKLYDHNGDGGISVENLRLIAKQLGEQVSTAELTEMVARVDSTGKGEVNFSDFMKVIVKRTDIKDTGVYEKA